MLTCRFVRRPPFAVLRIPGERQTANLSPATGDWRPATVVAHRRRHPRVHNPEELTATRLDIQTTDPDVRIIWFAQ